MGEDKVAALLQESLSVAVRLGAARPSDFTRVIADTTVAEKNVAWPTDAKLINKARVRLVSMAGVQGLKLCQSYKRVGKKALIQHQRYAHAKQFKRAGRQLKRLKTWLGRTIRDVAPDRRQLHAQRRIPGRTVKSRRVRTQRPRDDIKKKIYSLYAPEVECIGKGKAHKPYEFGVRVSIATTQNRCNGDELAVHARTLPAKPYDGHTLKDILPDIERFTGAALERILADAGFKGHNACLRHRFKVFTTVQKCRVTPAIKRQMKRRAAVEPVIGHLKSGHRMNRNYLPHAQGDAVNPILAATGYNFRLILKCIRLLFL